MYIPFIKNSRLLCSFLLTITLAACQSNMTESDDIGAAVDTVETAATDSSATATGVARTTTGNRSTASRNTARPRSAIAPDSTEEPVTDLWQRIQSGLQLHDHYNHPDVDAQLQEFVNNQAYFDLTIERARPFLYSIVEELDQRGLPLELALLPFVESAFNPTANSSESAVGLWQFMGATAASFGLQQDWWYDARRDPHASTIAALDYLEELVQQFEQDWLLALAAYNAGDGNVRRAIRRNDSDTAESPFWDLALPAETRSHVPRVLALAKLVDETDHYGIELAPIANAAPLQLVEVGAQIDLAQAAQLAAMDYTDLRNLNPGYLQWATHPEQPQHILLPPVHAELLQAKLATLDTANLLTWDHYEIQPGDTLSKIARNLNTRVDVLQRVNNLRGSQIIAGRSLLIPRGPESGSLNSLPDLAIAGLQPAAIPSSYRIRSGDNLWSIARRFDLHSSDIAMWNGMEVDSILRPGQVINLSPDASASSTGSRNSQEFSANTYVVRKGDSMASIASRFNTDLADLLRRNNLNADEVIFPGQVIQIRAEQNGLN